MTPIESPSVNGVSSQTDLDRKSISSSLAPSPPTPTSPRIPNEIGLPPHSAENAHDENRSTFQSKRLCERWLDNLFMVLYDVISTISVLKTGFESVHSLASRMGAFRKTTTAIP